MAVARVGRGYCVRVSTNTYEGSRSLKDKLSVKVSGVQMLLCLRATNVLGDKVGENARKKKPIAVNMARPDQKLINESNPFCKAPR